MRSVGIFVLALGLLTTGVVSGTTAVDPDGDGVAPLDELREGTAILDDDTDDDGLGDGDEKRRGTDPTAADTDGDGLADGREVLDLEADPLELDTDGDGLDDGAEVREYGTDPTDTDTDSDGIDDGTEVREYGTTPTETDSDGDGMLDHDEVDVYDTDPVTADTDGDGLADGTEAFEHETDPRALDTDGDGLEDGTEVREHGTDPAESDTDRDGLSDGAELHRRDLFPDADPLRTDIYVEMDTMERNDLDRAEIDEIVAEFDDAPLENPDGSTGASLHVVSGGTIPWDSSSSVDDLHEYRSRYFDRKKRGYHYLMVVEDVAGTVGGKNIIGKATPGTMMVELQSGRDWTGSTVMHELGHSLGLSRADFEGIDSREYSVGSYPSVMNYNAPREYYGFSSGSGADDFDDWREIDENMHTPTTSLVTVDD